MVDFFKDHYGKFVTFALGWVAELLVGVTGYADSVLVALGLK